MAKYHCKICPFETDNRRSIGGHVSGHRKRGDVYPPRLAVEQSPLKPEAVADALLVKVVEAISARDDLVASNKGLTSKVAELTRALDALEGEKDRILKLHNEQVAGRSKMTDSETLVRLAGLGNTVGLKSLG